jgi:hypothetical protein
MKLHLVLILLLTAAFLFAQANYTVYITPTGKKYHTEFCRTIKGNKTAVSLEDAKARGYEACKVCRP